MAMSKRLAKPYAKEALQKLVDYAGSQAQLARILTKQDQEVTPQTVWNWVLRGQISKQGAIAVHYSSELNSLFSLTQLRPDVSESEWRYLLNKTQ